MKATQNNTQILKVHPTINSRSLIVVWFSKWDMYVFICIHIPYGSHKECATHLNGHRWTVVKNDTHWLYWNEWRIETILSWYIIRLHLLLCFSIVQNDTAVIATHALLGFSLLGTLCAWMGLFQVIAPRHRPRMMSMYPRIILNVNVVCFYSASVAVILSPESEYENPGTMTGNQLFVLWVLKSLPSYRELMGLAK